MVAKQGREIVHIVDQRVDVAVVVIVAKSGTAAGIALADAVSHRCRHVFELAVAHVLVNEPGILEGLANFVPGDLGIDMAVYLDNIGPAIVVVVHETASPGDVLVVDADAGGEGYVTEGAVPVVVIEIASVIGKVGFENIEPAVTVVIGNSNAHPGLLVTIFAVGASGDHRNIGKGAVVIVAEQNAGLGIDRDVNVGRAVVVEIGSDGGN